MEDNEGFEKHHSYHTKGTAPKGKEGEVDPEEINVINKIEAGKH